MKRCVNNNFSFEGFWRQWHSTLNKWIIRYMCRSRSLCRRLRQPTYSFSNLRPALQVHPAGRPPDATVEHVDHIYICRALARPLVPPPTPTALTTAHHAHFAQSEVRQVALACVGLDQLRVLLRRNYYQKAFQIASRAGSRARGLGVGAERQPLLSCSSCACGCVQHPVPHHGQFSLATHALLMLGRSATRSITAIVIAHQSLALLPNSTSAGKLCNNVRVQGQLRLSVPLFRESRRREQPSPVCSVLFRPQHVRSLLMLVNPGHASSSVLCFWRKAIAM
jgi:hypothetical protein